MHADHIHLEVPSDASYVGLVRLAATQLGAQSDFSLERIEDVRIAVGEAVRILVAGPIDDAAAPGGADVLAVDFATGDGGLAVRLRRVGAGSPEDVDPQSRPILEATTSRYRIGVDGSGSAVVSVDFEAPRASDSAGSGTGGPATANRTEG